MQFLIPGAVIQTHRPILQSARNISPPKPPWLPIPVRRAAPYTVVLFLLPPWIVPDDQAWKRALPDPGELPEQ